MNQTKECYKPYLYDYVFQVISKSRNKIEEKV